MFISDGTGIGDQTHGVDLPVLLREHGRVFGVAVVTGLGERCDFGFAGGDEGAQGRDLGELVEIAIDVRDRQVMTNRARGNDAVG